jgi:excisionase family DNA binding protein
VTAEHRAALRLVAESLPAGTAVPIIREQLLQLLDTDPAPGRSTPPAAAELLTVKEVAARLNCGKQFVYRNARSLGAVKVGQRSVRFPSAAVDKYVGRRSLSRMGEGGR